LYRRDAVLRLDVRTEFSDTEDINSILNCAAEEVDRPTVEFSMESGYLWNTYHTSFSMQTPMDPCRARTECPPFQMFPERLIISVPGKMVGAQMQFARAGADRVELRLRMADNYPVIVGAHMRAHGRDWFDVLKVDITSSEFRYDINTILAVLGLIFGSGLLIELMRRLFRRGTQPAAR